MLYEYTLTYTIDGGCARLYNDPHNDIYAEEWIGYFFRSLLGGEIIYIYEKDIKDLLSDMLKCLFKKDTLNEAECTWDESEKYIASSVYHTKSGLFEIHCNDIRFYNIGDDQIRFMLFVNKED